MKLQKCMDKFDGGADPSKGCFAKLEAKTDADCSTTDNAAPIETLLDQDVETLLGVLGLASSTTTSVTTSTTSTTGPACVDRVLDGGFEAGPNGGVWTELSTNFGTPICSVSSCGTGGGTGPHGGIYWVYLGGTLNDETASVSQSVVIDTGIATLTFWLEIPSCDALSDASFSVRLDGNTIFTASSADPACNQVGYVEKTINVSNYADGNSHVLELRGDLSGQFLTPTNFFVDDVRLETCPCVCQSGT